MNFNENKEEAIAVPASNFFMKGFLIHKEAIVDMLFADVKTNLSCLILKSPTLTQQNILHTYLRLLFLIIFLDLLRQASRTIIELS